MDCKHFLSRALLRSLIASLQMCNVASDPDVARLIILLDLKRFAGKLSSIIST